MYSNYCRKYLPIVLCYVSGRQRNKINPCSKLNLYYIFIFELKIGILLIDEFKWTKFWRILQSTNKRVNNERANRCILNVISRGV